MNKKRFLKYLFGFLLAAFSLVLAFSKGLPAEKKIPKKISLIVPSNSYDSLGFLAEGAEKAAENAHAELNLLVVPYTYSTREQQSIINRELETGTDAIIISPVDHQIAAILEEVNRTTPIIYLDYLGSEHNVTATSTSDNTAIGTELGQKLFAIAPNTKTTLIVASNPIIFASNDRFSGLEQSLSIGNSELLLLQTEIALAWLGENTAPNIGIIALDELALKKTADFIASEPGTTLPLLGVGYGKENIAYIEKGIIAGMVTENNFNRCYLAVSAAVNALENHPVEKETIIQHKWVDKENMYDIDRQHLLFPVR